MPLTSAVRESLLDLWDADNPEAYLDALADAVTSSKELVTVVAASGAALNIDCSATRVWNVTLDHNAVTLTLVGAVAGQLAQVLLFLHQDGTGNRVPTLAPVPKAPGATLPVWSTGAGKTDYVRLGTMDGGVTWYVMNSAIDLR